MTLRDVACVRCGKVIENPIGMVAVRGGWQHPYLSDCEPETVTVQHLAGLQAKEEEKS